MQSIQTKNPTRNKVLSSFLGYPRAPEVGVSRIGNKTVFSIRVEISEFDIEFWEKIKDDPDLRFVKHPLAEGIKKFLKSDRDVHVSEEGIFISRDFRVAKKMIYRVKSQKEMEFIKNPFLTEMWIDIDYECLLEDFHLPEGYKTNPYQDWLQ